MSGQMMLASHFTHVKFYPKRVVAHPGVWRGTLLPDDPSSRLDGLDWEIRTAREVELEAVVCRVF